jgi:hypothetical protein
MKKIQSYESIAETIERMAEFQKESLRRLKSDECKKPIAVKRKPRFALNPFTRRSDPFAFSNADIQGFLKSSTVKGPEGQSFEMGRFITRGYATVRYGLEANKSK